jgi:hypothetical protein
MTTDVFYAILKLVSGEELVAKVCAFIKDGEVLIVLDNPITVNMFQLPNMKTPFVKVEPWLPLIDNQTHIINRKSIITINEIKDQNLVNIHQKYVQVNDKNKSHSIITPEMGYVNSIETARKSLESLYQSQDSSSKFE